jgi:hypothetical protein
MSTFGPLDFGENEVGAEKNSPSAYLAPLRQALIDKNKQHVNVVVCESDYRALKRGIEHLLPGQ